MLTFSFNFCKNRLYWLINKKTSTTPLALDTTSGCVKVKKVKLNLNYFLQIKSKQYNVIITEDFSVRCNLLTSRVHV